MEFLKNEWVVGIGTGVIVYYLTTFLSNRFTKVGRISKANNTLLDTLRGYVINAGMPSEIVLDAVKTKIARTYKLKQNDLIGTKEICEHMITEILGNTYISIENQKVNIEILETWIKQSKIQQAAKDNKKYLIRKRIFDVISIILAIISAVIASIEAINF